MEDQDVLTPIINSQDLLCSQEQILAPDISNVWGRLYPENKCLKIEGLIINCGYYCNYTICYQVNLLVTLDLYCYRFSQRLLQDWSPDK